MNRPSFLSHQCFHVLICGVALTQDPDCGAAAATRGGCARQGQGGPSPPTQRLLIWTLRGE